MKNNNNIYTDWLYGNLCTPKVYLIRVYYTDYDGVAKTCLKVGFTSRPIKKRISEFLCAMSKSTGYNINYYEILSITNTNNHSKLEYFLHMKLAHHHFYHLSDVVMKFDGSDEVLCDSDFNLNTLQDYGLQLLGHSITFPYRARYNARKVPYDNFNVV